ncbi:MAG: glycosyltransferase [Actinomycetota bacterium]
MSESSGSVGGAGVGRAGAGRPAQKVSLITTVKDSAEHVEEFLASVRVQTRPPDEVVVVDGGSTDGTRELLQRANDIVLIEEPGANISRGRNIAIAAATHDVLVVSDADCVLEPGWLEHLVGAIQAGADVAMGAYRPITESFFQECMASLNLPDPADVDPDTFMPSARSVAYTRAAIEGAGGYPEWLDIGEDMLVDHQWREMELDMRYVPDAVAHWRLRRGLPATWRQYFRYARGDAIAGMYPERHALRYVVYAGALVALASRRRWVIVLAALAGAAYVARPIARATSRFTDSKDRAAAAAAVPALMAFIDAAKMAGYLAGLVAKRRRDR